MYFWKVGRLEQDFHAVELENTAFTGLANLVRVEKLELADTTIMVVLDADATAPLLDLTFGSP